MPWIHDVRAHAQAALERLLDESTPDDLSRARNWVESCERAGLHVDLWEMRHFLSLWLARLSGEAPDQAAHDLARAGAEKLGFSPVLFAGLEAVRQ